MKTMYIKYIRRYHPSRFTWKQYENTCSHPIPVVAGLLLVLTICEAFEIRKQFTKETMNLTATASLDEVTTTIVLFFKLL